jgi:Flp pilus assembly protein TadG
MQNSLKTLCLKCAARLEAAFVRSRAFRRNEAAAAAVLFAVASPILIGAMGIAAEVSYWRLHQRAMQNAADAAAIAAATNAGSTYVAEAQAVAAQYGFQNGSGNIVVTVTNPTTASGCTSKCYTVSITDKVPLLLSKAVGFSGNTTVTSAGSSTPVRATSMQGTSIATSASAYKYCIMALGTTGVTDITANGAQKADLGGCNVVSNAGATCNGGNLNAGIVDAHGTNKGCGTTQNSNMPIVTDPYTGLASSIPLDTCNSVLSPRTDKQKLPGIANIQPMGRHLHDQRL